ncbi:MAG: prolyl oligopeptidase family serine peptidase [Rubricoccaceae bacterium]
MPRPFGLAVLLLAPLMAWAQITPEDVVRTRAVGAVVLSPDGRRVAFTVSTPRAEDEPPGPSRTALYVIPFEGGTPAPVLAPPAVGSRPAWLADGRLAFTARLPAHPATQVYAVRNPGDTPERLTDAPEGVLDFQVARNLSAVVYTTREGEDPERAHLREKGFDQVVAGEDWRFIRLFHQPIGSHQPAGGSREQISPPDRHVNDFALAPDGRTVAVQLTRTPSVDDDMMFRELFVLAPGREAVRVPTEGKLGPMAWSPDGRRLAYLGATRLSDPLPHHVFVADAATGQTRNVTPDYEATVEQVQWLDDDALLLAAVEGTRTAAVRLDLASGRRTRVLGGGLEITRALSFAGDRVAAAVNTRTHPNEVYTGSFSQGLLERRTDHNPWLAERRMARQETISWTGAGGLPIEGVLVYPLDYEEGERYPLAILPHGGPEGISIDGWNTRALYPAHVMAREGYVVLKPNYRGSGGRGPAFSMANHRDLGGTEFEDVLLGIDHLAALGLVDPDRVGISGTSYGGYFSAWATTRHAERFRAGITFAGLSNWLSFMGTTDIPHEMALVHWDLYYWEAPELYNDRSPVTHVAENTRPTLVLHGLADERVHPEQSIQLYNLLRLRGVPTGLVMYPREPHGLLERAHQLDFMRRQIDWFERYVKPLEVAETGPVQLAPVRAER